MTCLILEEIDTGLDLKGLAFCTVYADFSKEFEKVDHSILRNKLVAIGVGGKVFEIIEDYLSGRNQFVRCDAQSSNSLDLTISVRNN